MKNPPSKLREFQQQFGQCLAVPFSWDNGSARPQGHQYPKAFVAGVLDHSEVLKGRRRIEIYNEQYWFRLLSCLQKELPTACALLGFFQFNQWATDYLTKHPSKNPSLNHLLDALPDYLPSEFPQKSPQLLEALQLDHCFSRIFTLKESEVWNPQNIESPEELLFKPLHFQKGFTLIQLQYNLIQIRGEWKKKETVDTPLKKELSHWALFRQAGRVCQEPLPPLYYRILKEIQEGFTLEGIFSTLEKSLTTEEQAYLQGTLQEKFSRWSQLGWFEGFGE